MREAFIRLREEGWLRAEPNCGCRVVDYHNIEKHRELYYMRMSLETGVYYCLAQKISAEQVSELEDIVTGIEKAQAVNDATEYRKLDAEFHIPIVYVTHDLHEIVKLAKTVVLLKEGKVAGNGPIEEVFSQLNLRHLIPENHLGALVETTVAEQDQEFRLTKLAFSGGHLHVPHQHRQIGERLRVQILAKDVSIISSPPSFQTSVLNLLEATVVEIGEVNVEHPFVDIKLDIGCPLLATITRKSLATLKLHPGQHVHAQIKAVALSPETHP